MQPIKLAAGRLWTQQFLREALVEEHERFEHLVLFLHFQALFSKSSGILGRDLLYSP